MGKELKYNLVEVLTPYLRSHGFLKQKATWHRELSDIIQVFNVQGSAFEGMLYLNLGVYLRELG